LHVHDGEDEAWIVLDGEISFFVGDARYDLQGGQVAHGPRGVPHSYLVRSPRSRMVIGRPPSTGCSRLGRRASVCGRRHLLALTVHANRGQRC
jgi:hypothetical protein